MECPWSRDTPSCFVGRVSPMSLHGEKQQPLGRWPGGGCPGGAGPQASSCVFQADGNGVGKDTAPYGANESWEDFQPQLSL